MKKIITLSMVAVLTACMGQIKNENGSETLNQVDGEPLNCLFLYSIETEVSVYDSTDAKRYLENKIINQTNPGDTYWIVAQRTRPNEWAILGPERAYVLNANVYDCSKLAVAPGQIMPSVKK